jgi:predicted ABC-type ATPase
MPDQRPQVIIIAGPNGAGKSNTAPALLQLDLGLTTYVNADAIARGMSAFEPDTVAFEAGRIMLERIRALAAKRANFAFETTLAGRSYAHYVDEWTAAGYCVNLFFIWLRSPEISIQRIANRVRLGGHSIPEDTIRHRYAASIRNLLHLFIPRCTRWIVMDNSEADAAPALVAEGGLGLTTSVFQQTTWNTILSQASQ